MKRNCIIIAGLAMFLSITAHASTSVVLAVGTNEYSELIGGPAIVTTRQLTIAPGEVLPGTTIRAVSLQSSHKAH